ncbi:glutathione S-transferase N-terminal domain-containing protein [uncultured Parasphingopyxis sp.]|uniref:glutathione S-transferase N-terminal domain-containing protein n=1 Tax=uncultured Parasphingopyxis sp. TaxID=1547918 RepID=UPI00261AF183|nr:glutathione S-transferase N-terminal domain-containing protein [uncultured Parasphingopyxis sp.]
MIDVYFTPTPNGHKVSIMLEETGLEHRLIKMDMLAGEHLTPEFREVNPNGRLPAIVDHDPVGGGQPLPVFESGAILLYLAEKSGQLLPDDPRRRSQAQQWLMWQMAGFGPMQGQAHHFIRYAPEGQDYPVTRYRKETIRLLHVLERRLTEADFLAEEYSIADIATWPWVRAIRAIDFDLADFPAIQSWFDTIGARPAVERGTDVKNAANLSSARPVLTDEQWSNLFGDNLHKSAARASQASHQKE